jgi:hypothetical protein
VLAETLLALARWLKKASTSAAPISRGCHLPWKLT